MLKDSPEKKVAYLNLYGPAHCGPNGSILDGRPIDRIPVSTMLLSFPSEEGFMVKAKGDSMAPRIRDGDFVIARRANNAESGSIVVCLNKGEAIIKKIQKEKKGILLVSLNQEAVPPFLASDDFRIQGEVKGIFTNRPQ